MPGGAGVEVLGRGCRDGAAGWCWGDPGGAQAVWRCVAGGVVSGGRVEGQHLTDCVAPSFGLEQRGVFSSMSPQVPCLWLWDI